MSHSLRLPVNEAIVAKNSAVRGGISGEALKKQCGVEDHINCEIGGGENNGYLLTPTLRTKED